jgi:LuxR family maltose regulon positive regulatory protein
LKKEGWKLKTDGLLLRKNIHKELHKSITYPLTLVTAPMGYGKTTVVTDFFDCNGIDYVSLYFEAEESSSKYIWDTLAYQVKSINEKRGRQLEMIGFPYSMVQRNQVYAIISSIARVNPLYVIVDDYQFNKSSKIDNFIKMLVCGRIKDFHFIILSRTTPDLNITELVLKNICYKISEKDFYLSLSEVGKLFKIKRADASREIIEQVFSLSEGWISAVLLLIDHYKETRTINSVDHIEELIKTTIMKRYLNVEDEIAVLGILDSFSIDQLNFILGSSSTKRLTEILFASNTFIRYKPKSKRYSVHNIFMKYLYTYHFKKLPIHNQKSYYCKAGKWFVDHDFVMEGIRCFLAAEDFESILVEFEKKSIHIMFDYYPHYINEVMGKIPDTYIYTYPLAYLCYLHFLITARNVEAGLSLFKKLTDKCKEEGLKHRFEDLNIEGELEYLKSFIVYNDVERMFYHQKKAYEMIGGKSLTTRPDKMPCAGSCSVLYMYYRCPGGFEKTAQIIRDHIKYYEFLSGRIGTGLAEIVMAEYYLEIGEIDQATQLAKKGLLRSKRLPQYDAIICATYILARCAISEGRVQDAITLIKSLTHNKQDDLKYLFQSVRSPYFYVVDAVALKLNQPEHVSDQLQSQSFDHKMLFFQSKGIGYILYGQLLLKKKQYIELEVFCEELTDQFKTYNYLLGYIHAYILEGLAAYHNYKDSKGLDLLEYAFDIGRPDGIVTTFAEYGEDLLPLMKSYREERGFDDPYVQRILDKTESYIKGLKCYRDQSPIRPLTKREKEIMNLLCTGMKNCEIAESLYISESAVKKMLYSVYKKFNVKNRTTAIQFYNEDYCEKI